jgi:hypothetical protein
MPYPLSMRFGLLPGFSGHQPEPWSQPLKGKMASWQLETAFRQWSFCLRCLCACRRPPLPPPHTPCPFPQTFGSLILGSPKLSVPSSWAAMMRAAPGDPPLPSPVRGEANCVANILPKSMPLISLAKRGMPILASSRTITATSEGCMACRSSTVNTLSTHSQHNHDTFDQGEARILQ